jgi:hypothetical protein
MTLTERLTQAEAALEEAYADPDDAAFRRAQDEAYEALVLYKDAQAAAAGVARKLAAGTATEADLQRLVEALDALDGGDPLRG